MQIDTTIKHGTVSQAETNYLEGYKSGSSGCWATILDGVNVTIFFVYQTPRQ